MVLPWSSHSIGRPGVRSSRPDSQRRYLDNEATHEQESDLKRAKAFRIPDLTIGAGYAIQGPQDPDNPGQVALNADIPLLLFNRNQAGIRQAELSLSRRRKLIGARLLILLKMKWKSPAATRQIGKGARCSTVRTWTIPAHSLTAEGFQALQKEYLVTYSQQDNTYTLRKQILGRTVITNYDPAALSPDERARLIDETDEGHPNDVYFDIRPGHFGGDYPLKGDFRLRSFNRILSFLGQSLDEDPEYYVEKDPRTPEVAENPIHTMEILVSDSAPSGIDLSIQSQKRYYAVNTTGPLGRWNSQAFQMLYLLFQMTVSEVPRVGVPSITIAK